MAKNKKTEASELMDLVPNSVSIKLPDESSVIVPTDKIGNKIANMVVAAQIRAMLQKSISRYNEQDMLPTPKDLRDLAEAGKSLSQFSKEIFQEAEGEGNIKQSTPVKPEQGGSEVESVDFDVQSKS